MSEEGLWDTVENFQATIICSPSLVTSGLQKPCSNISHDSKGGRSLDQSINQRRRCFYFSFIFFLFLLSIQMNPLLPPSSYHREGMDKNPRLSQHSWNILITHPRSFCIYMCFFLGLQFVFDALDADEFGFENWFARRGGFRKLFLLVCGGGKRRMK